MANASSIQAELVSIYNTLANQYVLLAAGKAAVNSFINSLAINVNIQTGTITESGIFNLVVQLRQINQTFQISFAL
jgi:hypothetical protein